MTSFASVRSSRQIRAFYHCELERPIECTPFTGTEQASRIQIEVVSGLPTLPANLCPFSGCHECEGLNGKVCSSELHLRRKLTQTKYHRKMNSAELGAQSSSI